MLTIEYSPTFAKMYRRLPADAQRAAEKNDSANVRFHAIGTHAIYQQ